MSEDDFESKYGHLRAWCGSLGVVRFAGHTFVFRQPNTEHGRFWRRAAVNPAANPDAPDDLAKQLIVAFDDVIATDLPTCVPVRLAFGKWLEGFPLAMDNGYFGPVLAELLGQTEPGTASLSGKDCRVSRTTPATSR
jgi:hypothetical protein